MTLSLGKLTSFKVTEAGRTLNLPHPLLLANMPTLHWILDEIVEDWRRAVSPFQVEIDRETLISGWSFYAGKAFIELQPIFLKCLFSYVVFFEATDRAYKVIYESLNRANHLAGLNIKHSKPPKTNPYIDKVRRIRNLSVSHQASSRAGHTDVCAAMSWTPMTLSWPTEGKCRIEDLTFGGFKLRTLDNAGNVIEESSDFEIKGMSELHNICGSYLAEFDAVCADYLRDLHDAEVSKF